MVVKIGNRRTGRLERINGQDVRQQADWFI